MSPLLLVTATFIKCPVIVYCCNMYGRPGKGRLQWGIKFTYRNNDHVPDFILTITISPVLLTKELKSRESQKPNQAQLSSNFHHPQYCHLHHN